MVNFKKKKSIIFLFFMFISLSVITFSQDNNPQKDENQKNAESEKENKRIVSLSPGITETLFYFGYGPQVVGRTDYCITPEEVKVIPSMGTMFSPNMERIFLENPKYIIEQTHFEGAREKIFHSIGIKTLTLKTPQKIEDIIDGYRKIIDFLENEPIEKDKKLRELDRILNHVEKIKLQGDKIKNKPQIYYSLGGGHTEYTAGKKSFIDDIITYAGGENIVKEPGWTYSLEGLIYSQPDIIILSKKRYESMIKDSKYNNLQGLRDKKRVIIVEEDEITLPTPRLLLETLSKIQKGILHFNSL